MNTQYIFPLIVLFYAILKSKGIELRHFPGSTVEELVWSSGFFMLLGVFLEYFEYKTKGRTVSFKLKLFYILICKFITLLCLGYIILYFGDVYNNELYFTFSIVVFMFCGFSLTEGKMEWLEAQKHKDKK